MHTTRYLLQYTILTVKKKKKKKKIYKNFNCK